MELGDWVRKVNKWGEGSHMASELFPESVIKAERAQAESPPRDQPVPLNGGPTAQLSPGCPPAAPAPESSRSHARVTRRTGVPTLCGPVGLHTLTDD